MMRKQSQINNRWSTSSGTELSTNNPNINVNQIQEIFSKFQHQLEQNVRNITKQTFFFNFSRQLNNETFPQDTNLNVEIDDESSIEYDYTNPLSTSITNNIQPRHVSIATIYLQDEQWVKINSNYSIKNEIINHIFYLAST